MPRILLVDDDRSVLQLLTRALSRYELTVARDGLEALAASLSMDRLDLLITDYLMPELVGDELIARIRRQRPELKVLVITGHADILEHEAPPWWLHESHLPKPFCLEALQDRVATLIGQASVQ